MGRLYVYPARSYNSKTADMDVMRSPNLFPAGVTITVSSRSTIERNSSGIMLLPLRSKKALTAPIAAPIVPQGEIHVRVKHVPYSLVERLNYSAIRMKFHNRPYEGYTKSLARNHCTDEIWTRVSGDKMHTYS